MKINFNTTKTITTRPVEIQQLSSITIERIVDDPNNKIVLVFIKELYDPITLWCGNDYDNIGQWTDNDVINKLNSLF